MIWNTFNHIEFFFAFLRERRLSWNTILYESVLLNKKNILKKKKETKQIIKIYYYSMWLFMIKPLSRRKNPKIG